MHDILIVLSFELFTACCFLVGLPLAFGHDDIWVAHISSRIIHLRGRIAQEDVEKQGSLRYYGSSARGDGWFPVENVKIVTV